MVLIGLLVASLACLVVGLLLANAAWLIGSLVVSAVAGYLLWREREHTAGRSGVHKDHSAPKSKPAQPALVSGTAFAGSNGRSPKPGRATEEETSVWVVDGHPEFHAETCADLDGVGGTQAIPLAQAQEDGFTECLVCTPLAAPRAETGQVVAVWVVDGRPDYHVEDCKSLKAAASQSEKDAEPVPRPQAVGDGFTACPDCLPDGMPEQPSDSASTVWVIDGRPRYHLADCLIIKNQQAEEIPREQAAEDGFMACSMCEPDAARV
jgi:hypothetical protein